ncbi:DUF6760 family protein [Thiofilum sp.]|uniref:DUF6760 family protein n=1 Tax=Thiofilum sp. TaxID=2212733 RepID=UPI0034597223
MRIPPCCRARTGGGIVGYPIARLYEEVAFIAYHLHWSPEQLMTMEHRERRRWVAEVSQINQNRMQASR